MNINKNVVLLTLYVTFFLNSTGLGTSNFLLPVYAETLGATYSDLGKIGAFGNIMYLTFTLLTGYILDKGDRLKLYLLFTLCGSFTVSLFAFTSSIIQVIYVRGLLGVFSATFWVTASTLTANIAEPENLTRAMGRYNLAWILGFTLGPIMGGFVINLLGFRAFFFSLGGLLLISSLIILKIRVPEILETHEVEETSEKDDLRRILFAYLTLTPFAVILGIYMAIIPGHMKIAGLTSANIGLLIATTNGVRGLSFFNVEKFVSWGKRRSLFSASVLISSSMFLIREGTDLTSFGLPLITYGIGAGIITPVVLDYITKNISKNVLGRAMGFHEAVYGMGMCLGPLLGGKMADSYGTSTLYLILAFLALLILPLAWKMTRRQDL